MSPVLAWARCCRPHGPGLRNRRGPVAGRPSQTGRWRRPQGLLHRRSLRRTDETGQLLHWILEIHLLDRERGFGGFYEELLDL